MVNDNVMLSENSQSEGSKLSSCTCTHDFKFLSTTGGVYFGKGGTCIHIKGRLEKNYVNQSHTLKPYSATVLCLSFKCISNKNNVAIKVCQKDVHIQTQFCFTKCQDIIGIRTVQRGAQKLDEIFKLCPNLAILYKRHQYKLLESCNSYCIQGCCRSCNCLFENKNTSVLKYLLNVVN